MTFHISLEPWRKCMNFTQKYMVKKLAGTFEHTKVNVMYELFKFVTLLIHVQ